MALMVRGAACLLVSALGLAQQPASVMPEEFVRLGRVRAKMSQTLTRLPNYTCTQTFERSSRANPTRRFRLEDTLRIEVAYVDGKEMFAWPGETKFEEKPIEELSQRGSFGTGLFAGFATNVFRSDTPTFRYEGEEVINGRPVHRYSYEVPQFRSTFLMNVDKQKGIAGYRGSFWADTATEEVVRLSIEAFDIPPNLPVRSSADIIDYRKVEIGGVPYLLPATAETLLVDVNGGESKNFIRLANCRQYAGESTLIFDEAPEVAAAPAVPPPAPVEITVPEGISLDARLETPLDTAALAIGDPVRFVLTREGKHKGVTFLPKGALLTGRIAFARSNMEARPYQLIGIDLAEITFNGASGRIAGELLEAGFYPVPGTSRTQINPSPFRLPGLRAVSVPAGVRNVFLIPGSGQKLPATIMFRWRTLAATPAKDPAPALPTRPDAGPLR